MSDVARLGLGTLALALLLPVIAVLPNLERTSKSSAAGLLFGEALFVEGTAILLWLARAHVAAGKCRRGTALGCAALALMTVGWRAYYVEPRQLEVRQHTVERDVPGGEGRALRILHLTDIQTPTVGEHEEQALRAGLAQRPDLIVMTGDYVQNLFGRPTEDEAMRDLRRLMARLDFDAPLGVYATEGDAGPSCHEVFSGTRVTCLIDASVSLPLGDGDSLGITGLSRMRGRERSSGWLEGLLRSAPPAAHRIVISHSPDFVDALPRPRGGVDLVLAGHAHGGQVVLPWLGPLYTASRLSRRYAGGLHDFHGTPLHVSRGVGMERGFAPQVRFLCPPEICVVDLRLSPPAYRTASLASSRALRSTPQR